MFVSECTLRDRRPHSIMYPNPVLFCVCVCVFIRALFTVGTIDLERIRARLLSELFGKPPSCFTNREYAHKRRRRTHLQKHQLSYIVIRVRVVVYVHCSSSRPCTKNISVESTVFTITMSFFLYWRRQQRPSRWPSTSISADEMQIQQPTSFFWAQFMREWVQLPPRLLRTVP